MIQPFLKAVPVIEKIEKAGYEAYFVGGSVRDYILHKNVHDVDIATSAEPDDIKQIFPRTVDVGIEHGTVLVIYQGIGYEITTFRAESEYKDYRRPKDVTFIRSLHEDLKRRDFTMNAIAMTKNGEFIDPFGGQKDIENKLIRTVGSADERFNEDALRIMRALRFVSQLSFTMEEETFSALKKYAPLLEHIAVERKLAEFEKILGGENVSKALQMMVDRELYKYLPGFRSYPTQLLQAAELSKNNNLTELELWSLLVILFNLTDEKSFLRAWKLPVKKIKAIQKVKSAYEYRTENDWTKESIYHAGLDYALHAEKLYRLTNHHSLKAFEEPLQMIYQSLPIKDRKQLVVTGNDLMDWMKKGSGPWIKNMLDDIERAVINGEVLNDKTHIKEWLIG